MGLCGALAACKIEPIEELEIDEPMAMELPDTVQPLALPAVDVAGGAARWGEEPEQPEDASPRGSMAAIGRDLVLPFWIVWGLAGPAEPPPQ
jgi:hypothetical protein